MKGINPTVEQKVFHDSLCHMVGCIACRLLGHFNDYCSIHHMNGRASTESHWTVLPLCGEHHQIGEYGPARHKNKTTFEEVFGSEDSLLTECKRILIESGYTGKMENQK